MNIKQANKINMPDLLSRMGYQPYGPARKGGREYWYLSPFRKETKPSFHTTYIAKDDLWVWNDFGDEGGSVLKFIMHLKGTDAKGALRFLREVYQGDLFEKHQRKEKSRAVQSESLFSFHEHSQTQAGENLKLLEFRKAHNIENSIIFKYLQNRGIPEAIANRYLLEIKYLNKKRNSVFYGFGMKNESGGYELRAASHKYPFKTALIKRDISFIQGKDQSSEAVHIFEGMLDALSFLVLKDLDIFSEDILIMHSTATFEKAKQFVASNNYQAVKIYMDNDETGKKATQKFQEAFGSLVIPQNAIYQGYNDVNDFLLATLKQKPKMDRDYTLEP